MPSHRALALLRRLQEGVIRFGGVIRFDVAPDKDVGHPPRAQRVFWAWSEGAAAVTLLLLGGLSAIRNAAISLGLPMSLVLILASIALWRTLRRDPEVQRRRSLRSR